MGPGAPDPGRLQEEEYRFPYHYIPHFDSRGAPSNVRSLRWGFEYLCCLLHVVEHVRALAPASLLDVGCGDGRLLHVLGEAVPRRVGVDRSARSLAFARAFNPGARFVRADASELGETFDVVTAVEVIEHVPDGETAGFVRALADRSGPRGHVILTAPTTRRPVTAKHHRHYTRETLAGEVARSGAPLEPVRFEELHRPGRAVAAWERLAVNRWWCLEVPALRRAVWARVWGRRLAPPGTGTRVVGVFRRR